VLPTALERKYALSLKRYRIWELFPNSVTVCDRLIDASYKFKSMHCNNIFKFICESHVGLLKMNSGKIMI